MNTSQTDITREYCEQLHKDGTSVYYNGRVYKPGQDLPDDLPTAAELADLRAAEAADRAAAEADASDPGDQAPPASDLPDDLPGRESLLAAEVTTLAAVKERLAAGTLTEINGIGESTATAIAEALED